ncbi:MAG: beta-lactamase family protein [Bacteroidales bacterium]|nr:beta-lactamase family protein [Bacteroidales bacterium]
MCNLKKILITAALIVFLSEVSPTELSGQISGKLPRSIPESEGVSSSVIIDFLNAVDTAGRVELHSFMFLRHGKVIAEGWWEPYGPDYRHLLYSASKTFTATAIGLAVSENRLRLTNKVYSFFPYSMPDTISDYMKELTVQNLLTMSVGQDPEPRSMGNNGDWINTFLSTEPKHKPGTVFMYNNMATFMLSAIVQQITGQTLFDYLQPRLFKPLGIGGADWDLNPQGINLGMIGLRVRSEDLAKFGQLLLQQGVWNKKQLIPKEWVKEATSFKIDNFNPQGKQTKEQSDWAQGYCYQMWRGRNNTVRVDGMGGQFVVLIPDKDAVVVLTANSRDTQDELNLIHNYLIPAIKSNTALPANQDSYNVLQKKQSELRLKTSGSQMVKSGFETKISGREFVLEDNDYNIQSVYFAFNNDGCSFALKRDNQISILKAGSGSWKTTRSSMTSLLAPSRNISSKSIDANYSVPQTSVPAAISYSWTDDSTLELIARFVEESLGSQTISFRFSDINGMVRVTIEQGSPAIQMRGPAGAPPRVQLRGTMVDIR